MEQKLKEFKNRRRREYLLNIPKNFLIAVLEKFSIGKKKENENKAHEKLINQNSSIYCPKIVDITESSVLSTSSDVSFSLTSTSGLTFTLYFLYFLLWIILYSIAIQLEFGFVFLVTSGLVFMFLNTRTRPRRDGEISAYSVFNPGCHSIQGTLKAEDLEKQFNFIQH